MLTSLAPHEIEQHAADGVAICGIPACLIDFSVGGRGHTAGGGEWVYAPMLAGSGKRDRQRATKCLGVRTAQKHPPYLNAADMELLGDQVVPVQRNEESPSSRNQLLCRVTTEKNPYRVRKAYAAFRVGALVLLRLGVVPALADASLPRKFVVAGHEPLLTAATTSACGAGPGCLAAVRRTVEEMFDLRVATMQRGESDGARVTADGEAGEAVTTTDGDLDARDTAMRVREREHMLGAPVLQELETASANNVKAFIGKLLTVLRRRDNDVDAARPRHQLESDHGHSSELTSRWAHYVTVESMKAWMPGPVDEWSDMLNGAEIPLPSAKRKRAALRALGAAIDGAIGDGLATKVTVRLLEGSTPILLCTMFRDWAP
eukprot:SAG31_NODE_1288_length_8994_cov_4.105003_1_plen_375_part_00